MDEKDESKIYRAGNDSVDVKHEQRDEYGLPEFNPNYSMISNNTSFAAQDDS